MLSTQNRTVMSWEEYDVFVAGVAGQVRRAMQEDRQRVYRFIRAFESLYGKKPTHEDAEGNFKIRVAQDMQMSIGGARYYLRLAAEIEEEKASAIDSSK